jgi:hypothetical protein
MFSETLRMVGDKNWRWFIGDSHSEDGLKMKLDDGLEVTATLRMAGVENLTMV